MLAWARSTGGGEQSFSAAVSHLCTRCRNVLWADELLEPVVAELRREVLESPWIAECRFHLDSRQQAGAILLQEMGNHPATTNVCPIAAVYQIRALTGQVPPTICNETQAQAACVALVSEILGALRSDLIRPTTPPPP